MKKIKFLLPSFILTVNIFLLFPKQTITREVKAAQSINITDTSEANVRNYYHGLNSLTVNERKGNNLLLNLKPILKTNHTTTSYAGVWNWSKITERDWVKSPLSSNQLANYNFDDNPYVHLLYRNDNGTSTAAKANDTHGSIIDREHIWPKSLGNFGENAPAGTDVHHLMLADSVNNQQGHSNYDYGAVNPSSYTPIGTIVNHNNTGKKGTITYNGKTSTVYEPQDEDKGDIARAMFYMAARYSSYTSSSDPFLQLVDGFGKGSFTSTSSSPGTVGILSTLLSWHTLDPVSDYEIHRNNLIYHNFQHNRNPFIDYPSWVEAVWGNGVATPSSDYVSQVGQSQISPSTITLSPNTFELQVGNTQQLTLSLTPSNASNSVVWSSSNPSFASVSNGLVTGINPGTVIITATSTLNNQIKGQATVNVTALTPKLVDHLQITNYPSSLKLGETYSPSQISVTAFYNDNTQEDITHLSLIQFPDTSILGLQNLSVDYLYNGITTSAYYEVKITNLGVSEGGELIYASDLIISEYVEGSSNNKYLEIYNGTGNTVNLSDYEFRLFANGKIDATSTHNLSGTLAHNQTKVYKNSSAALTLPSGVSAEVNSVINFNGNDALGLYKKSSLSYVDIFGVIGNDPGSAWSSNSITTVDKTLVRKPSVTQGVTSNPLSFDPSLEWIQYNQDDASHLGNHTMNIVEEEGITPFIQAEAYAHYFLNVTGEYCEEGNGLGLAGSLWNELASEYSYMLPSSKDYYKTSPSDPNDEVGISGAKARYEYLVYKYPSLFANNFLKDGDNLVIYNFIPNSQKEKLNFLGLSLTGLALIIPLFGIYFKKRKII